MSIFPIIMCGGAGTRLWPASRPSRPKQFLPLIGDRTLFRQTVDRALCVPGVAGLVIIAGQAHRDFIAADLNDIENVITLLEPEGRDSAPAIAVATQWIARHDPKAIAAVMASDHFIPDNEAFAKAIETAALAARQGRIITLGMVPTAPTSAYGYISGDKAVMGPDGIMPVLKFVEKPDIETAKTYIADGYFWNSGNFIFAVETMIEALQKNAPGVLSAARAALDNGAPDHQAFLLGDKFRTAPKISIDYAVMETTDKASVLPVTLEWSDLGAWDAVMAASPKDKYANCAPANSVLIDTHNSYIHAPSDMTVATIGMRDVAIIADHDAVLVCPLDQAQSVKSVAETLKKNTNPARDIPGNLIKSPKRKDPAALRAWLFNDALPIWATLGADDRGWGFHEALSVDATPLAMARRARVQARQVYVFAMADKLGWTGPTKSLITHGLSGLDQFYRRSDGLYRTLVDAAGNIIDDRALAYDQAFVLLALAQAHHLIGDAEARALDLLSRVQTKFSHPNGGFCEDASEPFQSNPHMHLFEATLAWMQISDNPCWRLLASDIAELAISKFIDPAGGFVREFFTPAWIPAAGTAGTIVEPGHQFEWAWLLNRWSVLTNSSDAYAVALRLHDAGNRGVDIARQVAVDSMNDQLKPTTANARLWPQTERIKSAIALGARADNHAKEQFHLDAIAAAATLARYLDTPVNGLWWDKCAADGSFDSEPASGSSLYHIIGAVVGMQSLRR